jgi:hypothetical protein
MSNEVSPLKLLTSTKAASFAEQALSGIRREYPNVLERSLAPGQTPRQIHPAFYGCFDWHSAVHNHWLLVQLLRLFPALPQANAIRAALSLNLTAENLLAEAAYFNQPEQAGFERMYGWAWLLKLAEELSGWQDQWGQQWLANLNPLVETILNLYKEFLPRHTTPNREGTHHNTAFGLAFALDYARNCGEGEKELEKLVVERSLRYFREDHAYPAELEPGKSDFLSPALIEADLMSRVLANSQFREWFKRFLPGLVEGGAKHLLYPVLIEEHNDPWRGHLDGLNLSRGWCLRRIASQLEESDPSRQLLLEGAERNGAEGLAQVFSGDYLSGGHWLASFALYYLTSAF